METKHVGRVRSTGKKCVVVFRTLPGDAYNCLIAPTESLPDAYHDALINLVESSGGQSANEFGEIMARSQFPDGSIMLAALHVQNRLVKVSTDQIEMIPTAGVTIVLSELNQIIAEQQGVAVDSLSIKSGLTDPKKNANVEVQEVGTVSELPKETADVTKTTSSSVNETAPAESATPEDKAKFYRSQADKLAKEAAAMRRLAEELSPTKKSATK